MSHECRFSALQFLGAFPSSAVHRNDAALLPILRTRGYDPIAKSALSPLDTAKRLPGVRPQLAAPPPIPGSDPWAPSHPAIAATPQDRLATSSAYIWRSVPHPFGESIDVRIAAASGP